jgi:hypothetical protein
MYFGLPGFSAMEVAMWRKADHFRLPTRTAIIVWMLIVVGAIGMVVVLVTEKNRSVALLELAILGVGLIGMSIVIFVFNYCVFRDCDPRKKKS